MRHVRALLHAIFALPPGIPPFLVWGLASFHAAALIFVAVFYLYLSKQLAGVFGDTTSTGTLIGLAAFAGLWMASFIGTTRAFPKRLGRKLNNADRLGLIMSGSYGGFVAGGAFLLIATYTGIIVASVIVVVEGQPTIIILVIVTGLLVGLVGGIVAAAVGSTAGIVAGVIDMMLLEFALKVAGPLPPPSPNTETPAT